MFNSLDIFWFYSAKMILTKKVTFLSGRPRPGGRVGEAQLFGRRHQDGPHPDQDLLAATRLARHGSVVRIHLENS